MGVIMVILLVLAMTLFTAATGLTEYNTGVDLVYRLDVTQDVTLERLTTNFNYLRYLIVARHPGFPNKRSLIKFENPPASCKSFQIQSAKMYLYYEYSHKASYQTIQQVPFIPRYLELHLMKKFWLESQATSSNRIAGVTWGKPRVGLDGTDAEAKPLRGRVTIEPYRPRGFVEFDVTDAVIRWRNGTPNYGLVIRATNEEVRGRDVRFASNASSKDKHAYIIMRCKKTLPQISVSATISPARFWYPVTRFTLSTEQHR